MEKSQLYGNINVIDVPEQDMQYYLSINSAAKLMDMHPNSIRNFIRRGLLHAYQIGDMDKIYVLKKEVESLVKPVDSLGNGKWKGKPVYG